MEKKLRRTLFVYIFMGFIAAAFCSIVTSEFFNNWKIMVIKMEFGNSNSWYVDDNLDEGDIPEYARINGIEFSDETTRQLDMLDAVWLILIVIIWIAAFIIISHMYYKKELEEPLEIIHREMEYISRDDLSFDCSYLSGNEMEEVCRCLNNMRNDLVLNKQRLWQITEEQREINAAFAHDIRTPATVIRGYTEMIEKYNRTGQISEEKLVEIIKTINRQAIRIEEFSLTMKKIRSFEEWNLNKEETAAVRMLERIRETAAGMGDSIRLDLTGVPKELEDKSYYCDTSIILEVMENLVTNAKRFARERITIRVSIEPVKEHFRLYIYVVDDGKGFSPEALSNAARPYFTSDDNHFGLGLTISRILCRKHGGDIELANSISGGAIACGYFEIEKVDK